MNQWYSEQDLQDARTIANGLKIDTDEFRETVRWQWFCKEDGGGRLPKDRNAMFVLHVCQYLESLIEVKNMYLHQFPPGIRAFYERLFPSYCENWDKEMDAGFQNTGKKPKHPVDEYPELRGVMGVA